ncbi:hypothetical protein ACS0TY_008510 [Phlomoides rotata]
MTEISIEKIGKVSSSEEQGVTSRSPTIDATEMQNKQQFLPEKKDDSSNSEESSSDQKLVRNICILAHVDHGKTTLADHLFASYGGGQLLHRIGELKNEKHVKYILSIEKKKDDFASVVMEHLRLNGAYWGLMTLDVLGKLDAVDQDEVVSWVMQCQHESGCRDPRGAVGASVGRQYSGSI